jgi:hypothetical protein
VALQLRLACKALLNPQKLDQTRKQVTFPRTAPKFNDPVELADEEALELAELLKRLAEEGES